MDLAQYLGERRGRIDAALEAALPPRHPDPGRLTEAMRYTLLLPAKRMRGVVCLATAEAFGGTLTEALPLAVATEMVHASSLILDDLPCFDDAARRRGAPVSHRVFGEAVAILAAVGLLTAAFRHLARHARPRWLGPDDAVGSTRALAEAVGEDGMIAGEALDLLARGTAPGLPDLEKIHALKTGSLFIACAGESARIAGAGAPEQCAVRTYAKNLGLAFQITDDLLDAIGDPEKTGKDIGADAEGPSFVSFSGVDGAQKLAHELIEAAARSVRPLGRRADRLVELAVFVERRDR